MRLANQNSQCWRLYKSANETTQKISYMTNSECTATILSDMIFKRTLSCVGGIEDSCYMIDRLPTYLSTFAKINYTCNSQISAKLHLMQLFYC